MCMAEKDKAASIESRDNAAPNARPSRNRKSFITSDSLKRFATRSLNPNIDLEDGTIRQNNAQSHPARNVTKLEWITALSYNSK